MTWAHLPSAALSWVGKMKLCKFSDMAERGHCTECGSQLFMSYLCQPERVSISAGSIDEKSVKGKFPKIDENIFVGEGQKAGWYNIDDKLPKHRGFDAPFQKKLDKWRELLRAPGLG